MRFSSTVPSSSCNKRVLSESGMRTTFRTYATVTYGAVSTVNGREARRVPAAAVRVMPLTAPGCVRTDGLRG
ncbi:hypothetical protein GCM10027360_83280 [Amycolatopsis echigonensis]